MTKRLNLLLITAADGVSDCLLRTLRAGGFEPRPERIRTAAALAAALRSDGFDLAVADERSPAFPRLRALGICRRLRPGMPVIVLLESESVRRAVAAIRAGAADVLPAGELRRAAAVLKRALRRGSADTVSTGLFESVFESMHTHVAYLDPDFNFVRVNRAYAAAGGHPPGYFVGRNHFELYPLPENEAIFRRVRDTGRSFTTYAKPFVYADAPDRGTTYWDWSLLPVKGGRGRVKGLVLSLVDVTERVRGDQRLEQAKRLEALGTMAGIIAHDFNNILMPILLNTEMAMLETGPDNPVRSSLSQVLGAARLGKDLAGQIIQFSRPARARREPQDLAALTRETLALLETFLPRNVRIEAQLPEGPCPVEADRAQFHHILMNVCKNGLEAMAVRGGVLRVELGPWTAGSEADAAAGVPGPGRYWRLVITDTGAGMSRDALDKLFDPFFTSKGRSGGTGLGLALAPSMVKNHGGTITVESRPGAGTTFRIHLPRLRGRAARRPDAAAATSGPGRRILLVDDEPEVLDCLRAALERLGHGVEAETDAGRALQLFAQRPAAFDLVILDRLMPGLTGEALAARLLEIRPDTPILLCTGDGKRFEPAAPGRPGIRDILWKPFSSRDIAAAIARLTAAGGGGRGRPEERRG